MPWSGSSEQIQINEINVSVFIVNYQLMQSVREKILTDIRFNENNKILKLLIKQILTKLSI